MLMAGKVEFYKPVYTANIPHEQEEGIVYISFPFGTAIHLCPCGCGVQAVTPFELPDLLRQYQWVLSEHNDKISLFPSILNTGCPNKAHYFITNGQVIWC
jgi:hypothetical protein